jgi:hypothetical protein
MKTIDRLLARYLQKRGWVVFWLDGEHKCNRAAGICWLEIYESEMRRKNIESRIAESELDQ